MTTTSLRAVTHRLTTTPVQQLPPIASFLATSLSDCGELLSAPQNQKAGKTESDNALQIQKLKTRLASLLQDKSFEGRWTAVVLMKATVEAGQWEVLRGCEPLVRSLIGVLAKPDPVTTKKMCIITLTRIFHLTYQYPTLVREITTPSLPGFIASALNLVSVKPSSEPTRKLRPNTPFLETVLHALLELIARHPTTFRPFSAQIHSLLQAVIGMTSPTFPEPVVDLAEKLFISLHNCAPKNTSGDEWKNATMLTVSSIHRMSDYVFRSIVEQWESVDPALRQVGTPQNYSQEMGDDGPDPLGFPSWRGIHSGVDRHLALLRLLSSFFLTPTVSTVSIPIGHILDLTSRLTSVIVPTDNVNADVQPNLEIGREERDSLWAELPRIHAACMKLLLNIVNTLGTGTVSIAQTILEQATWVFRAEKFSKKIRVTAYDLVRSLLSTMGPSMTKQNMSSLTNLFRACCSDLLPPADDSSPPAGSSTDTKGKSKGAQVTMNADSFLVPGKSRQTKQGPSFPDLTRAASELLPTILTLVPTELLAPSVRAEIDRTIILTADKNALLASVLNPVPAMAGRAAGSSIIPFLARGYTDEMEVEALIRPRMPVLMNTPDVNGYINLDEEEEEGNESEPAYQAPTENTGFLRASSPAAAPTSTSATAPSKPTTGVETAQTHASSMNKRVYAEGPTPKSVAPAERKEVGQAKRARFEKDTSAAVPAPAQPSVEEESPATFTGTPAIPVEQSSMTTTSTPPLPVQTATSFANSFTADSKVIPGSAGPSAMQTQQGTATVGTGAGEESDDEMPTLNLEPDSDEEDEEDVAMDG